MSLRVIFLIFTPRNNTKKNAVGIFQYPREAHWSSSYACRELEGKSSSFQCAPVYILWDKPLWLLSFILAFKESRQMFASLQPHRFFFEQKDRSQLFMCPSFGKASDGRYRTKRTSSSQIPYCKRKNIFSLNLKNHGWKMSFEFFFCGHLTTFLGILQLVQPSTPKVKHPVQRRSGMIQTVT